MLWHNLPEVSGWDGPALYGLRLVTSDGQPIPIPTLLGGPDASGVVDIGESDNLERRRLELIMGIQKCAKHSAGILWRYLCQFTRLQDVYPYCRLQYTFQKAASKSEAEILEGDAVKEYIIRFGQLPILNRELPRAYDDEAWNRIYEQVWGPTPDDYQACIPV
jgi:hypothetical protein